MNIFLCLALILVVGGAAGFLLNRLRLPALLGYLVLGIIIGYTRVLNPQLAQI